MNTPDEAKQQNLLEQWLRLTPSQRQQLKETLRNAKTYDIYRPRPITTPKEKAS